jgi:hypothetical protein
MYWRVSHWTDLCEIWYWVILWTSVEKVHIWVKPDKNAEKVTWRFKCVSLLPATLHCHKCVHFYWNGVRLLIRPSVRMYHSAFHWKDVREISCWVLPWETVEITKLLLNYGENIGHITWIPQDCLLLPTTYICHEIITVQQSILFYWWWGHLSK